MPAPKDEYDLITRWKNGDDRAFNQLFDLHFYKLYRFALRHTNDAVLSEELVMDLMLKVWQKKDTLQAQEGSLSAFLRHALKAALIDNYRKKRIEFVALENIPGDYAHPGKADDPLLANELYTLYRDSLAQLSPQKKLVLEMRQDQAMSYQEIADKLQISAKTVDRHLSDSVSFIRKYLRKNTDIVLLILCSAVA